MDNVIQHSTRDHGYIMGVVHQNAKHVAFCIADAGQGIYNSLRNSTYAPRCPLDAITLAIKEGVTRDTAIGQGNGLWGLHRVVAQNKGKLGITSGQASWVFEGAETKTYDRLPFLSRGSEGTTVDFQLDIDTPISIEDALQDKRSPSQKKTSMYMDRFDTFTDFMQYTLKERTAGTGTRASAMRIRNEIVNLLNSNKRPVLLDFDGVSVISSSFADELIGKLLITLGFVAFNQTIHLRNMNPTVQAIVQRSVNQRIIEELGNSNKASEDASQ
jgi:anti-anti-sigma regulatory factor